MGYTDITVLLDRSGSMAAIKTAMESGFEEFLYAHRKNPSTRLSLVQFDGENPHDKVYTALPVLDTPKLRLDPRGSTPLRDALCLTIDDTGRRLAAMRESERPQKVLFIVITDGMENASTQFSTRDVRERVERQRDIYSWEFVFLGANQDAILTAQEFSFDVKKAITYNANLGATRGAWKGLATNTAAYVSNTTPTASASLDWDDQQRKDSTT